MEPVAMPTPPANQHLGHDRISLVQVNKLFICQNDNDFDRYREEQDLL